MGLNSNMGDQIVFSILAHYRFPEQTFVGSPESVETLKQALDQERRKNSADLAGGQMDARQRLAPPAKPPQ